jgi:hypothetical protein
MKRNPSTATKSQHNGGSHHSTDTAATALPSAGDFNMGLDSSRAALSQSLSAAQALLSQMAQMQRLRLSAFGNWTRLLAAAQHEAEQAQDPQALMTVAANLVNSQWAMTMEQLGAQMSQWLENQIQLSDQMRMAGTELAKRFMTQTAAQGGATSASSGNGAEPLAPPLAQPLAQLGQLQDQWLAATQRWIDVAKSAQTH